jgi:hypothetical protein
MNKTSRRFVPAIRNIAKKDKENNLLSTYYTIRNEKKTMWIAEPANDTGNQGS